LYAAEAEPLNPVGIPVSNPIPFNTGIWIIMVVGGLAMYAYVRCFCVLLFQNPCSRFARLLIDGMELEDGAKLG
jgi:hypothetical protein